VSPSATPEIGADVMPAWCWSDLKPLMFLSAVTGFVVSAPVALVVSCNVHEIGHALVAVPLGWEVERINLCLPAAGSVEYARIGIWAGNLQGYAGGFIAATFLAALHLLVFAIPRRPLRGPGWWGSGLGVVLWVGPQIVIGILEGTAGPGRDYGDFLRDAPALYLPLIAVSMLAGVATYAWRWRVVFHPRQR